MLTFTLFQIRHYTKILWVYIWNWKRIWAFSLGNMWSLYWYWCQEWFQDEDLCNLWWQGSSYENWADTVWLIFSGIWANFSSRKLWTLACLTFYLGWYWDIGKLFWTQVIFSDNTLSAFIPSVYLRCWKMQSSWSHSANMRMLFEMVSFILMVCSTIVVWYCSKEDIYCWGKNNGLGKRNCPPGLIMVELV